jgi:hypothetical protein
LTILIKTVVEEFRQAFHAGTWMSIVFRIMAVGNRQQGTGNRQQASGKEGAREQGSMGARERQVKVRKLRT